MNDQVNSAEGRARGTEENRTLDLLIAGRYDELACEARRLLYSERFNDTLQSSALIHEAYLRMRNLNYIDWREHAQFLSVAVGVMRRVLIDHARSSRACKRGGDQLQVPLDENSVAATEPIDVLELNCALTRLADHNPIQAQIVKHRFFGGLTIDQTALVLEISPASVKRKWALAQAWLYRELRDENFCAFAETPRNTVLIR